MHSHWRRYSEEYTSSYTNTTHFDAGHLASLGGFIDTDANNNFEDYQAVFTGMGDDNFELNIFHEAPPKPKTAPVVRAAKVHTSEGGAGARREPVSKGPQGAFAPKQTVSLSARQGAGKPAAEATGRGAAPKKKDLKEKTKPHRPEGVISSLFSFNPEIPAAAPQQLVGSFVHQQLTSS
jgi:hypothetical protein